jgi:hypothetical protein
VQTFKVQPSPALITFSLHLESTAEGSTRAPPPRARLRPNIWGAIFAGPYAGTPKQAPWSTVARHIVVPLPASGMAVHSRDIFSRNTISPRRVEAYQVMVRWPIANAKRRNRK